MRRTLAIILTALTLLVARPAHAASIEDGIAGGATYQQVIREAQEMLAPAATQRNQTFSLDLNGYSAMAADAADPLRNRVLNLLANALAVAPAQSHIVVHFNPQAYQLSVSVHNAGIAVSTNREVVDPQGNAFRVTTTAGVGAELQASLLEGGLTAVDIP